MLTEEKIIKSVHGLENEDEEGDEEDEEMAHEPAIPSHSEAFTCFTKHVRWLEA